MNSRILLVSNQPALSEELTVLLAEHGYESTGFVGDPAVVGKIFAEQQPHVVAVDISERPGVLSPREREVVALLARGRTGEQVAKELFISPETVRTHVRNAMDKLQARTRTHAIVIALTAGEVMLSAHPGGDDGSGKNV